MSGWHWDSYTTRTMIGALTPPMAASLGFSREGCPYRGSLICHECPFAPPVECEYRCIQKSNGGRAKRVDCEHRYRCKCGFDQTGTLRAMGLVG